MSHQSRGLQGHAPQPPVQVTGLLEGRVLLQLPLSTLHLKGLPLPGWAGINSTKDLPMPSLHLSMLSLSLHLATSVTARLGSSCHTLPEHPRHPPV